MPSLDATQQEQIRTLCADGYALYDTHDMRGALRKFYQAWVIFPKPQTDFVEAGWVLTAIGDAYFRNQQFTQGREALASALHCEGLIDNPFIHMRLGQCLLELGHHRQACAHLTTAYQRAGRRLFDKEAPKYLMAVLQPDAAP